MKREQMKESVLRYLFMAVGCFFYAMSLDLFLIPNSIVGGGVTGAATLLNILFGFGVGLLTMALNLPILLAGLKTEGLAFIIRCLVTNTLLSVMIDVFSFLPAITENPILASVYGGVCQGVAIGIFYRTRMSSGGTELLGRILLSRFPGLSIGTMIAILDGIVVVTGAVVLKTPENVLYALIVIFISARLSDTIVTGLNRAKMCYIITDHPEEVSRVLLAHSPRGVTNVSGTGMYTHTPRGVLMTVVKRHQLVELKRLVQSADALAFVIVSETTEVLGKGFQEMGPQK